ncbi:T9SS type A sorting domain-containing protein [Chryseobacterium gambrini]|uniref:T9SS type A sorting domain-containing protein n=1 Tax=Chryseobacterium gambrini TaxID=373672 RepID=A0AAJ1VKB3_9FLAO|nr:MULTISPECIES: T9SS type A sorting domain-containing protein [Chryseobacterium]MDN4012826.1 T9SS type A sorting domain-containing protein [Chryseobacterium gambrini]MDN4030665.1 T9SS type A sorting domain-containing protein [Chryseobacterium gambrini]QWA36634.1 T9SS type A sorting domain-containing protein [Chryseobacterium sp. ZHDP1]
MKTFYLLCLALGSSVFAQTITFNGCHTLFDASNTFVFTKTGLDAYNKGIYITTPVTGDQDCGGLGTCEFKIQWNNALSRWEFLADEGNGTFTNPNLIYYNSTGNNNFVSNPPAITFGTWVENTAVTNGACGGNLTTSNATMTGDLHSTSLATSDVRNGASAIQIFPNPVAEIIRISGIKDGKSVQIYNMAGQIVKSEEFNEKVNVSELSAGIYLLKINTKNFQTHEFKFVKK